MNRRPKEYKAGVDTHSAFINQDVPKRMIVENEDNIYIDSQRKEFVSGKQFKWHKTKDGKIDCEYSPRLLEWYQIWGKTSGRQTVGEEKVMLCGLRCRELGLEE